MTHRLPLFACLVALAWPAAAQLAVDSQLSAEDALLLQQFRERQRRRGTPPPPMAPELYAAYEFRFRVLGNGACARYADEADAVLLDSQRNDSAKIAPLNVLGSAAKAANCLSDR